MILAYADLLPDEDNPLLTIEDDWIQAEWTLLHAPSFPHPGIPPEMVAKVVTRSLQWVDHPHPNAGLERCFHFLTYECRKAVTARRGADSISSFCQHAMLSPALQPFMGAQRVDCGPMHQVTYTPAQPPLRGALTSFPVTIHGAHVLRLQHPSGLDRAQIEDKPPVTHMVLRLEQQRRPPNQGCWLVREVLDVRHAFAGDLGNAHVGG